MRWNCTWFSYRFRTQTQNTAYLRWHTHTHTHALRASDPQKLDHIFFSPPPPALPAQPHPYPNNRKSHTHTHTNMHTYALRASDAQKLNHIVLLPPPPILPTLRQGIPLPIRHRHNTIPQQLQMAPLQQSRAIWSPTPANKMRGPVHLHSDVAVDQ